MDVVTGVELEYSYGAGDGRTRSGVASMPKERSGGPRLDQSCDWEKYGYDRQRGRDIEVLNISEESIAPKEMKDDAKLDDNMSCKVLSI